MPAIVADTGPLRYLVLIESIDILPRLVGRVLIPETVGMELSRSSTPSADREWLSTAPAWLERREDPTAFGRLPVHLDEGERAAIGLAQAIGGALLLMDDRAGIDAARKHGIEATGTLGVLVRAAQLGMVDLSAAFARPRATNFRYRSQLLDDILVQNESEKR